MKRSRLRHMPQVLRRGLQLGMLAFVVYAALGGAWRNYKRAHNQERLVTLMKGEVWGTLYGANEDALSLLGEPYRESYGFLGMPWSSRVFGIDGADPILVSSVAVQTGSISGSLLLHLLLPLGLALFLGKVFCSHLCPMRLLFELGQYVRRGLLRLGVPLPEIRSDVRIGGWILAGGLLATLSLGTAVWLYILPYVGLSTSIFLWITAGATTTLVAAVLFWLAVDASVAPGYFCHNLCPTGFLLEQFGRFAPFKLRKGGEGACPEKCRECVRSCPYGLSPREQTHHPACDACGRCAVSCPQGRLRRRVSLPVVGGALLAALLVPSAASAHHIKGLPHYGYFENYPQVPTEEYVNIDGRWELGSIIFNFQGMTRERSDTPNDVKLYLYLYDLEEDEGYVGPVTFEIQRDDKTLARFHRDAPDEEAVYTTRQTLPETGNYEVVAYVRGDEVHLPFYVELLDDGVDWLLVGGIGAPALGLFGLAVLGRSRKRPRRKKKRKS